MPALSIPFDAFTLAAVAADLRATVLSARLQKIQQPSANELVLSFFGRQGAQRVLLSADPRLFRIHRTTRRRENPVTPPSFCAVCRKYLENALLTDVLLPRFDRVLHLIFSTADMPDVRLTAELMGRNSNLLLVTQGVVRGILRPTPTDSERPLRPGIAYTEPPGYRDKVDIFDLTGPEDAIFAELPTDARTAARWLNDTFSGIGKFAALELMQRAETQGIPNALWHVLEAIRNDAFSPHEVNDEKGKPSGVWAFEPLTIDSIRRYPRANISVALDSLHGDLHDTTTLDAEKALLLRAVSKESDFRKRELTAARKTLEEAQKADRYEQIGNNLLASLFLVERGQTQAVIPDLYSETGEEMTVSLDPVRSPNENAEVYFARARKARDAAAYAEGQVVDRTHELAQLKRLEEALQQAGDGDALGSLRTQLASIVGAERIPTGDAPRRVEKTPRPFGGYRIRTVPVHGYTLLIGETAEANDYLTTRIAAPSDLWFHVRSAPGAHGVLRTLGKPDKVPETALRRAAEIVAARSGTAVKHASVVAVDVVEKRRVRKPRGAKAGLVTYDRERTLDVSPRLTEERG